MKPHCARTYRLELRTIERLDALAERTGVPQSRLVDLLLCHAFDQLDTGRLSLRTRPVLWELDSVEEL